MFRFSLVALAILTGCAITHSTYVPMVTVQAPPKESDSVQLLGQLPKRAALRLGVVTVSGNVYSDFDDLAAKAKKQAGGLGGDFVLVESSGHNQQTIYTPGYTSYQASAHQDCCTGAQVATSYSVGPTQETLLLPWATFSVWRYQPSHLGLRLENNIITGFHLNSTPCDLQPGDQLIGINGYDIDDEQLTAHQLTIQPGDPVTVTVQRHTQRLTCTLTALPN
jgi:hypothetical protein